ncbi:MULTISPECIES: cell division protein FtsQ/DivIB [unclassified Thalassolituus]|uniref:cell division protein FtsQ/DivIB n=1 Tax=unclassified Thalassolituus TaxID=2624967 RepID=UPI0025D538E4|nr:MULTISPECIES: FtsQ-type POTRA domain-containing protein [unclassified Thalassolituus]
MAKHADVPRGATPLKVKEKREWNIQLPSIPWHWVGAVLFTVVVIAGGKWAYQSWPIQEIEVNGRLSVWDANELAKQLAWVKNESFFSLDPQAVYKQLDALPLIKQVMVRKQWPGTLQVMIAEDLPMAVMNDKKLLSISGELSEIPQGYNTEGLARINGDEGQAETAVRYFRRVQQSLKQKELAINMLTVNKVGSVSLSLSNGWQVNLGRQYFEERLQRLGRLLADLPADAVESLDLRYGKGAAVRWRSTQEMG